ncbi:MAG: U32 family peptidase [Succiniclasticum sp.]|jgi:putative protease|nr:U32 family peptidase [Succiniclasticum sp.]MCI6223079.1 U32 family peptidase [Selenomonadales bacterium]MDY2870336.1 U32 family peptidase [Succiniclasticum sp.]MDY6302744.1 U32 family peptidase [Succiniclasticum sp.]MDY6346310.1 U32 family peptidase [Succiniclasticum sp.]
MRKLVKPELLAPAGSMEKLKMALLYGADAVYLGGKAFGLRAFASNFTDDELREAVVFAHGLGRKVYVTVNIFAHNADLTGLPDYLRGLEACGVDALLISDLGIWSLAREVVPHMPLHVSTQANTTNYASVLAWERLGASRVVLARELSLAEIAEIGSRTSVELEAFVHGAMCISYSGRCWLSNYLTGRDGNRGACAQICRWEFGLTHKEHPGEVFEAAEDEHGTYILNSKDLCLLPYLPDLMKAGVASFKIEGRMKSAHYAASVVSVYRRAIDACWNNPDHYEIRPEWTDELEKVSHRPYTTAFAVQQPDGSAQEYGTSQYLQTEEFTGLVRGWQDGRLTVEQRNKMSQGERLEVFRPDGSLAVLVLEDLRDAEGRPMDSAPHAQQIFTCTCADPLPPYTLLRRKIRNIQE